MIIGIGIVIIFIIIIYYINKLEKEIYDNKIIDLLLKEIGNYNYSNYLDFLKKVKYDFGINSSNKYNYSKIFDEYEINIDLIIKNRLEIVKAYFDFEYERLDRTNKIDLEVKINEIYNQPKYGKIIDFIDYKTLILDLKEIDYYKQLYINSQLEDYKILK